MSKEELIGPEELFNKILSTPPKPKNTYGCGLEEGSSILELFQFCMHFFHTASVKFYGDNNGNVDVSNWTQDNLKLISDYFESLGYKLTVSIIDPTNDTNNMLGHYYTLRYNRPGVETEEKLMLNQLYYLLKINKTGMYYILSFDIL
jgi:hypothetical protein